MQQRNEARRARIRRRISAAAGVGVGATFGFAPAAQATVDVIEVTVDDDPPVDGCLVNGCTLREAITQANADNDTTDADVITFNASITGEITLGGAQLPTIDEPLYIQGGTGTRAVDGNDASRIFHIDTAPGDDVTIANLTVRDGMATGAGQSGGAVLKRDADLELRNAVFTGNDVSGDATKGGAVASYGTIDPEQGSLTIRGSTFTNNTQYDDNTLGVGGAISSTSDEVLIQNSTISGGNSSQRGGGAYIDGNPTQDHFADITRTTISGNVATHPILSANGGGLAFGYGEKLISNSTISGNTATGAVSFGGGIYSYLGFLRVDSSTIVGNSATGGAGTGSKGGGIYTLSSTSQPTIRNTIVAGNSVSGGTAPSGPDLESFADTFQVAFSLIQDTSGAPITTTVPGSNITGQDPQLGALAPNGGDTMTRKPAGSSPVVDAGQDLLDLDQDQRELVRPFDVPSIANSTAAGADGSDIGAVELQATDFPSPTPAAKCAGRTATIEATGGTTAGTGGPDVIVGTAGANVIKGLGGRDLVCARGRRDRVIGGAGNDTLLGQAGPDTLRGGAGKDKLKGGLGRDRLRGGPGRDVLRGGPGRDKLRGGPGRDVLRGGPGRDRQVQ